MVNTSPTSAPTSHLHLLSLPQELQDIIFMLAYGRSPDIEIVGREHWYRNELHKQETATIQALPAPAPRTYPGDKVSEFMVSKQFFMLAAAAYVRSGPLHLKRFYLEDILAEPFWAGGVLAAFARHVVGDPHICLFFYRLADVRALQLRLDLTYLRRAADDEFCALKRVLSRSELAQMAIAPVLGTVIDALSSFEIVIVDLEDEELTEEEMAMLDVNIANLQAMPMSAITAPGRPLQLAKRDIDSEGFTPLYAECKVRLETSTMQSFVSRRQLVQGLQWVVRMLQTGSTMPPPLEATALELLAVGFDTGVVTRMNAADVAAIPRRSALRSKTEEKHRRAKSRLQLPVGIICGVFWHEGLVEMIAMYQNEAAFGWHMVILRSIILLGIVFVVTREYWREWCRL